MNGLLCLCERLRVDQNECPRYCGDEPAPDQRCSERGEFLLAARAYDSGSADLAAASSDPLQLQLEIDFGPLPRTRGLASPKSIGLAPLLVSMTLPGFKSR